VIESLISHEMVPPAVAMSRSTDPLGLMRVENVNVAFAAVHMTAIDGGRMSIAPSEHRVRSADGTDIGFLAHGRGPAIVFVHGGLTMGDEWRAVAAELADRFTCLIMTRRGRGRSGDAADYSLDKEREDIQAVMTIAGGGATLLGHSYGAVCALEAARVGAIRRLILYEPPLPIDAPVVGPAFGDVRAAVASGQFDSALTIMLRDLVHVSAAQLEGLRRSPIWTDMAALTPTVVRELEVLGRLEPGVDRFRRVSSPTLLLLGTETAPHHSVASNALQRALPNARTVLLDGQGHEAHIAVPNLVATRIAEFLRVE
jgi:pimeloyl-ACP methyl ester carboxylesterase